MLNMLFFTTEDNMVLSSLKQELERFGRYTRNCCTTKQATLKDLKRVVKGGYRSRFTKNKSALSQFTKNNNGISRFTKKKGFSDITYRYILKSYIQSKALFEVFTE